MKLEKWALIAEVIGSVAILVTLIVLIVEVRTNTELSRVAAYDAVTRDFDAGRRFWLSNPEAYQIILQMNQGTLPDADADPDVALKVILMFLNGFSQTERAYLAYQAGIFGDDEWGRVHRSECQQWGFLQDSGYLAPVTFRLTDDYVDHLRTTCTPEIVEEFGRAYRGDTAD